MPDNPLAIQSVPPARAAKAGNAQEFSALLLQAAEEKQPVAEYGTLHRGLGHPPPAGHTQVAPPAGVIAHYVADMTVRVAAGTTIRQLNAALAGSGQYLPLDGGAADVTIAEAIAHNMWGPLRISHGSTRDMLLGLRFADAQGRLITVGGRTVKNVAGYDVTRLMVGNLNMLGLIADATLRTWAKPQRVHRTRLTGLEPAALDGLITDLLCSAAAPFYLDGQITCAQGEPLYRLHVGHTGTEGARRAQHQHLTAWLQAQKLGDIETSCTEADFEADTEEREARRSWRQTSAIWVKVIVPAAAGGRTAARLARLTPPPEVLDFLPAHGVIHMGAGWTEDQALRADEEVLRIVQEAAGLRVWMRRPADSPRIAPFAPPQPDWPMLQRVKEAMDPDNRLNPFRFP